MNTIEILAVFVGIPVLIFAVLAALTLVPGRAKRKGRYRVGEPWEYGPQWWAGDTPVQLPSGDAVAGAGRGGAHGAW